MDAIAWAASAMVAARTRLEIAADNLANVSTDGFRGSLARGSLTARGVAIARAPIARHGALMHTGRTDDRAIVGDGAFLLRDARGRIVETRSGAFVRGADGRLRDDAGRVLVATRLSRGSSVRSGFLEAANVDAIGQMVAMLAAQRGFESAEHVVAAIDRTRHEAASDVAKAA
ncbi:MAG TPA: flagellar basal body rod C-terminal domain-containing protein [Candidatus Dormibacteraeota bacterium]|nr:flagellar basal body rod C-terminal domain-containing protein [Candidatus Dormibacteraeota bacterium]